MKVVEELKNNIPKDEYGHPTGCFCYRYETLTVLMPK
jgi:hypothetical protein